MGGGGGATYHEEVGQEHLDGESHSPVQVVAEASVGILGHTVAAVPSKRKQKTNISGGKHVCATSCRRVELNFYAKLSYQNVGTFVRYITEAKSTLLLRIACTRSMTTGMVLSKNNPYKTRGTPRLARYSLLTRRDTSSKS